MMEDSPHFKGVVPVLMDLLEPPGMGNIDKSFDVLYASSMITLSGDEGQLTSVGRLAGQLPVDLELGRMVAMGILLGIGTETCVLAMALSLPKTLFRIATRFHHHNPDHLHDLTAQILLGNISMDMGLYSEPLAMLVLYIQFKSKCFGFNADGLNGPAGTGSMLAWIERHCLVKARVLQFIAATDHMIDRVNKTLLDNRNRVNGVRGVTSKNGDGSPRLTPAAAGSNSNSDAKSGITLLTSDHLLVENLNAIRASSNCDAPALPENVINRLRLVLAWSGDSNLLRVSKGRSMNGNVDVKSCTQLRITNPVVTNAHLKNIFPPNRGIQYTLEENGFVKYQAKLAAERLKSLSAFDLLTEMVKMSSDSNGSCVWISFRQPDGTASADVDLNTAPMSSSKSRGSAGSTDDGAEDKDGAVKFIAIAMNRKAVSEETKAQLLATTQGLLEKVDMQLLVTNSEHLSSSGNTAGDGGGGNDSESKVSVILDSIENIAKTVAEINKKIAKHSAAKKVSATKDSKEKAKKSSTIAASDAADAAAKVFDIFLVQKPSKSVIRFFKNKKTHEYFDVSMDMNLLANGHATLQVSNMTPTQLQLESLFFANANVEAMNPKYRKVLTTVENQVKMLKFPNPFAQPAVKPARAVAKAVENEVFKKPERATPAKATHFPPKSLITDLPVGMRVLAAIQSKYKQDPIRIWQNPLDISAANRRSYQGAKKMYPWPVFTKEADRVQMNGKKKSNAPVGSKQWIEERDAEEAAKAAKAAADAATSAVIPSQQSSHGYDDGWDPGMEALKTDMPVASELARVQFGWVNDRNYSHYSTILGLNSMIVSSPTNTSAIINRESVCGVAYHCGNESLYGVSNGAMTAVAGFRFIVCQGVSFFPLGSRWLTLAYMARGFQSGQLRSLRKDQQLVKMQAQTQKNQEKGLGGSGSGDSSIADAYIEDIPNENEEILCQHIHREVQEVLDGVHAVESRTRLIALVDELFGFWAFDEIPTHYVPGQQTLLEEAKRQAQHQQQGMLVGKQVQGGHNQDQQQYHNMPSASMPGASSGRQHHQFDYQLAAAQAHTASKFKNTAAAAGDDSNETDGWWDGGDSRRGKMPAKATASTGAAGKIGKYMEEVPLIVQQMEEAGLERQRKAALKQQRSLEFKVEMEMIAAHEAEFYPETADTGMQEATQEQKRADAKAIRREKNAARHKVQALAKEQKRAEAKAMDKEKRPAQFKESQNKGSERRTHDPTQPQKEKSETNQQKKRSKNLVLTNAFYEETYSSGTGLTNSSKVDDEKDLEAFETIVATGAGAYVNPVVEKNARRKSGINAYAVDDGEDYNWDKAGGDAHWDIHGDGGGTSGAARNDVLDDDGEDNSFGYGDEEEGEEELEDDDYDEVALEHFSKLNLEPDDADSSDGPGGGDDIFDAACAAIVTDGPDSYDSPDISDNGSFDMDGELDYADDDLLDPVNADADAADNDDDDISLEGGDEEVDCYILDEDELLAKEQAQEAARAAGGKIAAKGKPPVPFASRRVGPKKK